MQQNWVIGRRWNVVHTEPRNEGLATSSAIELGWKALYLRYRETKKSQKRKNREVILPYIPGYIFVEATRSLSLWELGKADGVSAVVRMGGQHALIADTDPVMRRLLKMADGGGFVAHDEAKPITLYKNGDTVVLQNCPFELHTALIEMVDDDRSGAQVWLTMFGSTRKIHVKHDQIGEVVRAA